MAAEAEGLETGPLGGGAQSLEQLIYAAGLYNNHINTYLYEVRNGGAVKSQTRSGVG